MSFPSIDSPYRTSSASTTQYMHTCLLRATRPTTSRGLNSGGWAAQPVTGEGRER
jgi:hypothetical protein